MENTTSSPQATKGSKNVLIYAGAVLALVLAVGGYFGYTFVQNEKIAKASVTTTEETFNSLKTKVSDLNAFLKPNSTDDSTVEMMRATENALKTKGEVDAAIVELETKMAGLKSPKVKEYKTALTAYVETAKTVSSDTKNQTDYFKAMETPLTDMESAMMKLVVAMSKTGLSEAEFNAAVDEADAELAKLYDSFAKVTPPADVKVSHDTILLVIKSFRDLAKDLKAAVKSADVDAINNLGTKFNEDLAKLTKTADEEDKKREAAYKTASDNLAKVQADVEKALEAAKSKMGL